MLCQLSHASHRETAPNPCTLVCSAVGLSPLSLSKVNQDSSQGASLWYALDLKTGASFYSVNPGVWEAVGEGTWLTLAC